MTHEARYDSPFTMEDVKSLPAGTVIDFGTFSCLVVGDNTLLVFDAGDSDHVQEGSLLSLKARGGNDWVLSLRVDDFPWGDRYDYWVQRDWNGQLKCRDYDLYDYWDDWSDDYWADDFYDHVPGYDDDAYGY